MSPEQHWLSCYRHPARPAIRDCASCGRPICGICEEESGERSLCRSCSRPSERPPHAPGKSRPAFRFPARRKDRERPMTGMVESPGPEREGEVTTVSRRAELPLGELTVYDDGRVELPREGRCKTTGAQPEAPIVAGEAEVPAEVEPKPAEGWSAEQVAGRIPAEGFSPPAPEAPPPYPATARIETASGAEGAHVTGKATARPEASPPADKPPRRTGGYRAAVAALKKPALKTGAEIARLRGGLRAPAFGVAGGAAVFAFWLLLAHFTGRWTQFSVVAAGVAVPWAVFRGARGGERTGGPAKGVYVLSLYSAFILAGLSLAAEYGAFMILAGGRHNSLSFGGFLSNHGGALDIALLACGLALSLAVPYLLSRGGSRTVSLRGIGARRGPRQRG